MTPTGPFSRLRLTPAGLQSHRDARQFRRRAHHAGCTCGSTDVLPVPVQYPILCYALLINTTPRLLSYLKCAVVAAYGLFLASEEKMIINKLEL